MLLKSASFSKIPCFLKNSVFFEKFRVFYSRAHVDCPHVAPGGRVLRFKLVLHPSLDPRVVPFMAVPRGIWWYNPRGVHAIRGFVGKPPVHNYLCCQGHFCQALGMLQ